MENAAAICIRFKAMVNETTYFEELQIVDETKSADEVNERWYEVLERLDELAIEYAKELQADIISSNRCVTSYYFLLNTVHLACMIPRK